MRFEMVDEKGKILAKSECDSAGLLKAHVTGEATADMVKEHERLVDVLLSPSHDDDLVEAGRQAEELDEYRGRMSKAHVSAYTRKDGTYVKEHDDKRQAAKLTSQKVNAITSKHPLISKDDSWRHDGSDKHVPASALGGVPEFTHSEVYGRDGHTTPVGSDFSPDFKEKGHQGFVIKHKNGKRSFVDTQGYGYARYHAPVKEDAPAAGGGADHPFVVGKADIGADSPSDATSITFAGVEYNATGKSGNSMHDNTPVREFEADDGHRVWMDDNARVHADSKDEVEALKKKASGVSDMKEAAPSKPVHADSDSAQKKRPVKVKSQNEDWGYHGEAYSQYIGERGSDPISVTERQHNAAMKHAGEKFSDAANYLVDAGHFDKHDDARDFLDSKSGRHLHDGATFHDGDISKVQWLGKQVKDYKKANGMTGKPMRKALLFTNSGAELLEMSKAHVKGYARKDGTFVKDHETRIPSLVRTISNATEPEMWTHDHKKGVSVNSDRLSSGGYIRLLDFLGDNGFSPDTDGAEDHYRHPEGHVAHVTQKTGIKIFHAPGEKVK